MKELGTEDKIVLENFSRITQQKIIFAARQSHSFTVFYPF
jgi:hypothetical protein